MRNDVDGEMMFIEVAVTSFIDTDKHDFIKQLVVLRPVEIDLREITPHKVLSCQVEAKVIF